FWRGIRKLLDRCEKYIASDGQYFEDDWFASKEQQFFWRGIRKLLDR
ncbi:hypothetical protein EAI_07328, partial [Harpegnathos saltator]